MATNSDFYLLRRDGENDANDDANEDANEDADAKSIDQKSQKAYFHWCPLCYYLGNKFGNTFKET